MRLLRLAALLGTTFAAGAAVQQDTVNPFLRDQKNFRVDCDDWATVRPSDQEYWERMEPVALTMAEAAETAAEAARNKGYENVRVASGELVVAGKPYYSFELYTKHFNEKKQMDVYHRWEARVGVTLRSVKLWLIQERFPGTPVRGEVETRESGLLVHDVTPGDGQAADLDSTVKIHFTMMTLDGTLVFDTYHQQRPMTFPLANAPLAGIREGLQGMRVGGKRKLIIPPHLAYGAKGHQDIVPPNATVVYDVELKDVR